MSLLSDTNHTPQRVYALLRLLDAQGGQMSFDVIVRWLKPEYRGVPQRTPEEDHINIRQLLGASVSLGLIESLTARQYRLVIDVPNTLEAFADYVHDRLVAVDASDPDSILLEAYAAVVVLTQVNQQTSWLEGAGKDRAARIDSAVRPGPKNDDGKSDPRFNSTKFSAWQRWMTFLGLGFPLPRGEFYPYPVQRLERELDRMLLGQGAPRTLEIAEFMKQIANRMPYLDGGRLFQMSADQVRLAPLEREISRVLSGALRDLHDDGRLLLATIGDAKQTYALTQEPHTIRSIKTVSVDSERRHV